MSKKTVADCFTIVLIAAMILPAAGCGKKQKELTPAQLEAKADSIVRSRLPKLEQQAKDDLDKRLPIEMKAKADSIRHAAASTPYIPAPPSDEADTSAALTADTTGQ